MSLLTILLTDKCDYSCRHCAYNCEPSKNTVIPDEALDLLGKNVSDRYTKILLTGGEPFIVPETLAKALQVFRGRRVEILTNGSWIKSYEQAMDEFLRLEEMGVKFLWISDSDYHKEQGHDHSLLSEIVEKAQEHFKGRRFLPRMPHQTDHCERFGRAESIDSAEQSDECEAQRDHNRFKDITVFPDESIRPCCWPIPPAIGKVEDKPLEEMYDQAFNNPMIKALLEKGPYGAAEIAGLSTSGFSNG